MEPTTTSRRSPLPVIILTLIFDYIGFSILLPIGALLFTDPSSPYYLFPADFSTKTAYIFFGLLVGSYPLAQLLAAPVFGQLSDRYGRKPILTLCLLGTAASYALFAIGIMTRSIPLLFLARILDGITGGNASVAQASLADITEPKNRPKVFGLMGASIGVGITLGPLIGGKLADPTLVSWFNSATPFWFATLLSLVNALSLQLFFSETLASKRTGVRLNPWRPLGNIGKAFAQGSLRPLFATSFLFACGFTFYTAFAAVFLVHRFGFDQRMLGNFFFYTGILIVLTQALTPRVMTRWFNERQLLRFSLIGAAIFPLLYILTHTWWYLLIIFPFYSACIALSMANIGSLVSKSATQEAQGELLGINTSVQGLGQAIPPILGGFVAAGWVYYGPLAVAAALLALAGIVFITSYKPQP